MTVTGTTASVELTASAELGAIHTTGGITIGTPKTAIVYETAPDITYSLALKIADGDTLTMDFSTGEVTGTVAGAYQVETATVVAASGCTSNGTCNVVVTGARLTSSPITVPVALTTTTHTTATLIATAIKDALIANSVIPLEYTPGSSSANVTLTDLTKRVNDATLNIAIPAGLGITAALTSANTTTGVGNTMAYKISGLEWDATDNEGAPLQTATKIYSILAIVSSGSPTLTTFDNTTSETREWICPFYNLAAHNTGIHAWSGHVVDFTADGDVLLTLDIHAGT